MAAGACAARAGTLAGVVKRLCTRRANSLSNNCNVDGDGICAGGATRGITVNRRPIIVTTKCTKCARNICATLFAMHLVADKRSLPNAVRKRIHHTRRAFG